MNIKKKLQMWVELFNDGNAIELGELYHEKAVNHQMPNDAVVGKVSIKKMFKEEFSTADMNCIPVNIFVDGDTGILEWRDPIGFKGCGFFLFEDGKIIEQRGYWDKLSFLKLHNLPIK